MSGNTETPPVDDLAPGDTDDVVHHWCCDPKTALCGTKITTAFVSTEPVPLGPDDCAMCADMILSDTECSPGCFERYEARLFRGPS